MFSWKQRGKVHEENFNQDSSQCTIWRDDPTVTCFIKNTDFAVDKTCSVLVPEVLCTVGLVINVFTKHAAFYG
jgi:hypothetical protein